MGGRDRSSGTHSSRLPFHVHPSLKSPAAAWETSRGIISGVSGAVLPEHTQRALAACASEVADDRKPKDLVFMIKHAQALQPRTAIGWVALTAAGTCGASALAVLIAGTLMVSIAGLFTLGFVLLVGGGAIAAALGLMAVCLMLSALVTGLISAAAAGAYAALATAQATLKLVSRVVATPPASRAGEGRQMPPSPAAPSQPVHQEALPRFKQPQAKESATVKAVYNTSDPGTNASPHDGELAPAEPETTFFSLPEGTQSLINGGAEPHGEGPGATTPRPHHGTTLRTA